MRGTTRHVDAPHLNKYRIIIIISTAPQTKRTQIAFGICARTIPNKQRTPSDQQHHFNPYVFIFSAAHLPDGSSSAETIWREATRKQKSRYVLIKSARMTKSSRIIPLNIAKSTRITKFASPPFVQNNSILMHIEGKKQTDKQKNVSDSNDATRVKKIYISLLVCRERARAQQSSFRRVASVRVIKRKASECWT